MKYVTDQIKADPNDAQAYLLLGQIRYIRKETAQAEAACLKAISIDPGLVSARLDLAQLYAGDKQFDEALAQVHEILKIDPKNVDAMMISGIAYQEQGDIPKARKVYEALLAVDPTNGPAANNLAYIYCQYNHDYSKALSLAQIARQQEPANPNIADTLGWVLYNQKNYSLALPYLKQGAAKLPASAEIQYHLGMAQYRLGNIKEAKQALKTALKIGGADFKEAPQARRALSEMAKMPVAGHRGK